MHEAENVPSETIAEGDYIIFKKRGTWEYVERNNCTGIVVIIPVTDDGNLVLLDQYRPALQSRVIEIPAGLVGDIKGSEDEAFSVAVKRELIEETGYEAKHIEELFNGPASAGMSAEKIHFFAAWGLQKISEGGGDDTEDINVFEVALDEVHDYLCAELAEGKNIDPKIFTGLFLIQHNKNAHPYWL